MNNTCVHCQQLLPGMSKLTKQAIPEQEAAEKQWEGTPNGDGTVTVPMCLQCQINRSERGKKSAAGGK